jgi:hypothetical protein
MGSRRHEVPNGIADLLDLARAGADGMLRH